ncbi:MAG: hypothetical protein IPN39_03100 [Chitinophagaceae bacterium]|nr:hypothetical protein [Chitinophagaceae bacterium]MBP6215265.1 hypothetical protein [Chitinophagaceae bacterium]
MIKEFFSDTWENIKERVRNPFTEKNTTPFAGSFLIALIFYNWKLIFSLFNFDGTETRLTKLEIISNYLKAESWFYRFGNPILIAFASIVAFYILNNVSLGITTFFNRWFKATVLAIFDKSKIVTREELGRSMDSLNRLRHLHEDLKNTFAQSQATIEDLKSDIFQKDKTISEVNEKAFLNLKERDKMEVEKFNLENEYQKLKNKSESFRVLYAYYGYKDQINDVTEHVQKTLTKDRQLQVFNESFGDHDPAPFRIKSLEIIYEIKSQVFKISALEGSNIVFFEDSLRATDTEKSLAKTKLMRDRNKLSSFFGPNWKLFYTKENLQNSESMNIDIEGNYYTDSVHTFLIDKIKITDSHIEFRKMTLSGAIHSVESLEIKQLGKLYIGRDTNNYVLEYRNNSV